MSAYSLITGDFFDQQSGSDFTFLEGDSNESAASGGASGSAAYTLPSLVAQASNTQQTVISYYSFPFGDFTDLGLSISIAGFDLTTASGASVGNNFEGSAAYLLPSMAASSIGSIGATTRDGTAVTQLGPTGSTGRRNFGGARAEAGFDGSAAYTLPSLVAGAVSELGFLGTATYTLPSLQAIGGASFQEFGSASYQLPSISAFGIGAVQVTGSISVGLPALEALAQYVELPGLWYDINNQNGVWSDL